MRRNELSIFTPKYFPNNDPITRVRLDCLTIQIKIDLRQSVAVLADDGDGEGGVLFFGQIESR